MHIEMWDTDRPKDYPKNARNWTQQAVEKVGLSLREYGFRQPVVVDKGEVICVGHLRRAGARWAGINKIPVHVAHDLTPAQIKAYRLMDNRSHDEATWNFELLGPELIDLKALDFDLSMTGFEETWIDQATATNGTTAPTWDGMPAFAQEDLMPWQTLKVHFATPQDREAFSNLLDQQLTEDTKYVWYPKVDPKRSINKRYVSEASGARYPVYIVSKGRAGTRLTSKALEEMRISYHIVIEPQEYDDYASVIDPSKILTLPFSNLGQGSIPARNWIWEHAIETGAKRHWIMDDNISWFARLRDNEKVRCADAAIFMSAEDFSDRYTNIALSGFNYHYLAKARQAIPQLVVNTRIYSCILILNSIPFRWRGRYNEDTDLSLRVLKSGLCTVQFNAFLSGKVPTLTMKGGNTDELYQGDGRRKMAESLQQQHPDVVKITRKWGRWQHQVDYRPFKGNKLIPDPNAPLVPEGPNEYGMHLEENYSSV